MAADTAARQMDDPLQKLLRETDRPSRVAVRDACELSGRVLLRVRRRRMARAVASVAVIAAIGVFVLARFPRDRSGEPVQLARSDDSNALTQRIDFQKRLVDALLASEQRRSAEQRLASVQYPEASQPVERAAARVIAEASRLLESNQHSSAAAEKAFTQVIDCFPDTLSAETARKRLAELKNEG
jgi:hypothetical protein